MADNQNLSDQRIIASELASSLKSALKDQGDYNDLVRDSLRDLQKVVREYDKIDAKINALYSGQINTKKIQEEILKAKTREIISSKELSRITSKLSQDQIRDARLLSDTISQKIVAQQQGNAELVSELEEQILLQEGYLNLEQMSLVAAEQQYKLAKQLTEESQALLQQEKEISRMLGVGGQAAKLFAEKLGLGNSVYESMVIKARQLNEEGRKSKTEVLGAGLKEAGSAIFDSLTDPIPVLGAVVKGFKAVVEFILQADDKIIKFGRNLGLSKSESYALYNNFASIQDSSGELLTTTKNLMEVQTDLTNQLGISNVFSAEMLQTQIKLKNIMGLGAEEMAGLAQSSILSNQSQEDTVKAVLGQVSAFKLASGVSFNFKQIIGEASKLGGVLGLKFAKYPESLTKSLVATKALGMDLQKVDQIAGSLLNFEQSIQNQLEAQLLTGKNINLSRAQLLALEGDTAGVAAELSKQFGSANEFLKMNRIQQEAIAKAVGMGREDLADTLKNQEVISRLGARDLKDAQAKLQALKDQGKTQAEITKLVGEEAYQNLTQLSAQEKVTELLEKVKSSLSDFVVKSGIVEYITGAIDYLADPNRVKSLISTIREGVALVAEVVQKIAVAFLKIADYFPGVDTQDLVERLESVDVGERIRGPQSMAVKDFVIKPMEEDTITVAGGTRLGRTDEMVEILRQILNENKQGKNIVLAVDGQPLATAVARNASLTPAASSLGPRPLR